MKKEYKKAISVLIVVIMMFAIFTIVPISAYAEKLTYKYGDVDLNGKVNIKDVSKILLHLVRLEKLNEGQLAVGDFNGDGNMDIKDVSSILCYLVKLPYEFNHATDDCTFDSTEDSTGDFTEDEGIYNGFYYYTYQGKIRVSWMLNPEDEEIADIPNEINGKPVVYASFWKPPYYDYSNLKTIIVPENVTEFYLPSWATPYLENIIVSENNKNFCVIDGVLFDKSKETLLIYTPTKEGTEYYIPEGTKEIDFSAFYGASIEILHIPESVENINSYFLDNIDNLKEIYITYNTIINELAFYTMRGVIIHFPDGTTKTDWDYMKDTFIYKNVKYTATGDNADELCIIDCFENSNKTLTIPEKINDKPVTEVMYFSNYSGTIYFSKNITRIYSEAFNYWEELEIYFDNNFSDVKIYSNAFSNSYSDSDKLKLYFKDCTKTGWDLEDRFIFNRIEYMATGDNLDELYVCGYSEYAYKDKPLVIPEKVNDRKVTGIWNLGYFGNASEIFIPKSVIYINSYIFNTYGYWENYNNVNIYFDNNFSDVKINNNVFINNYIDLNKINMFFNDCTKTGWDYLGDQLVNNGIYYKAAGDNLDEIHVLSHDDNYYYYTPLIIPELFNNKPVTGIYLLGDYNSEIYIPKSITYIGSYVFSPSWHWEDNWRYINIYFDNNFSDVEIKNDAFYVTSDIPATITLHFNDCTKMVDSNGNIID